MNKTWVMLKANLANSYGIARITRNMRSKSAKPKHIAKYIGIAALVLAVGAGVLATVTSYYFLMAQALQSAGQLDTMLGVIAAACCAGSAFMSFYKAPGHLYASRDFDLLVPLPVKPGAILASKILSMYISSLGISMLITLPGIAVYGVMSGAGFLFYPAAIAMLMIMPLIPMVAGALVAFPVVWLGSRFKYSNAVTLILYIILMVIVIIGSMVLPMNMVNPGQLSADVINMASGLDFYPPVSWFAKALSGAPLWGLLIAAVSFAVLGLTSVLLARIYTRINAASRERHTRSSFKLGGVSVTGVVPALVIKDIKGFFSSYVYVLNAGIGMILFTIYNIAVIAVGFDTVAGVLELPGGEGLYALISAAVGAFCIALSSITAPSISVEGKTLWLLKSLPIRFADIAKGKILMSLTMTGPLTLINCILIYLTSGMGFVPFIAMALALCALCVFTAVFGLFANLLVPKLEWNNIVQAVKQSASVGISMIVNTVAAIGCGLFVALSGLPMETGLFASAAFLAVLSGLVWLYLLRKGQRVFDAL
ncbi:MAG: hypothetical protein LBS19_07635 [Clostridiales bacterium]|jgi:ABC-2 type transport system permease protein|nr:hypothetical protein [Clostridiales bacterium]